MRRSCGCQDSHGPLWVQSSSLRFVTFASAESGAKAVKLDGMKIHQQTLHIQYSRPRPRGLVYHPTVGEVPVSTTVQVTGLPPQVDDDWLYNIFSPCGEILYARTQRQRGVGGSLGFGNSLSFGHVAFTYAAAADKALKLVGLEIAGQCIRVERTESHLDARSHLQMAEANRSVPERIHINGLPRNFDNARLQREFEQFGEVLSAEVIRDRKSGQSCGFGFVQFASSDSVDEAIKQDVMKIDGFSLGIRRAVRHQSSTARPLTINVNPVS
ncbi:RNA-binding domain-containing protein [Peniophora sp. CONT]|nr:RNA-binding domain-containing protein [Peniophora sp. CONT]